jgi:hypothetical protein
MKEEEDEGSKDGRSTMSKRHDHSLLSSALTTRATGESHRCNSPRDSTPRTRSQDLDPGPKPGKSANGKGFRVTQVMGHRKLNRAKVGMKFGRKFL